MIVYKDVLQRLARAGWSSYRLRKEKQLPGGALDRLRENRPITTDTLDTICRLCSCQPGDLLQWIPDPPED